MITHRDRNCHLLQQSRKLGMGLGLLIDSGSDAHMVPEECLTCLSTQIRHMDSRPQMGQRFHHLVHNIYQGTWEETLIFHSRWWCFVAGVDIIILSPGLLRDKGVTFAMGPEKRPCIKLRSGSEVDLSCGDKKSVFQEAELSEKHPPFKPTQPSKLAVGREHTPSEKHKKRGEAFQRQGGRHAY